MIAFARNALAETALAPKNLTVLALIAANLIPLGGVLFYGWTVFEVMIIFWAENVIIGVLNILRMATLLVLRRDYGGLVLGPFFTIHYGMFTLVHGIFVISMFGAEYMHSDGEIETFLAVLTIPALFLPFAALAASHFFSYALNFLYRGEFRTVTSGDLMMKPYARVVVLHVVIIVGGAVAMSLGEPLYALVMLVLLKIVIDVAAHIREHRKLEPASIKPSTSTV
jgi:hypothetical protein